MSPWESDILKIIIIFKYKTSRVSRTVKCAKANFIVVLAINKGSHQPGRWDRGKRTKAKHVFPNYVAMHYHAILKYREMGDSGIPSSHGQNGCHQERRLMTISEQMGPQGLSDAHYQWRKAAVNSRPDLTLPKLGQSPESARKFVPQWWRPSLLFYGYISRAQSSDWCTAGILKIHRRYKLVTGTE